MCKQQGRLRGAASPRLRCVSARPLPSPHIYLPPWPTHLLLSPHPPVPHRAFVGKSFARSLDEARFTFFSEDLPKGDLIRYQQQLAACSPVRLLDLAALNKVGGCSERTGVGDVCGGERTGCL